MIDIVITADYEIFGNGTGDVRHCLVNPTSELLAICDAYGAKLTLFFEIVEYWAFGRAETAGELKGLDYSPRGLMEYQAMMALRGGHDVQLHLHPQWLDSEYMQDGWRVNLDYWCLPDVPHGLGDFGDVLSLRGLLSKGKHDLEEMLRPVRSDYECVALRAGGNCIQPARNVIQTMKDVGLLADSSVFKGGYVQEGPFGLDFRDAHSESRPWWADPGDINKALADGNDSILELPIYAVKRRRVERLDIRNILQWFKRRRMHRPPGCTGYPIVPLQQESEHRGLIALFNYLFKPVVVQWDYCRRTDNEMWWFLKKFLERAPDRDGYVPLIMIGHPKTFTNQDNFRKFLERLTCSPWFRDGSIRFSTMGDAVRKAMVAMT